MRITQGTLSFLPDLDDDEIEAQVRYAIGNGWALGVEYAEHPDPRQTYWELWCTPMFDVAEPSELLEALHRCQRAHPSYYVKVVAYDSRRQTTAFDLVIRPDEPR